MKDLKKIETPATYSAVSESVCFRDAQGFVARQRNCVSCEKNISDEFIVIVSKLLALHFLNAKSSHTGHLEQLRTTSYASRPACAERWPNNLFWRLSVS